MCSAYSQFPVSEKARHVIHYPPWDYEGGCTRENTDISPIDHSLGPRPQMGEHWHFNTIVMLLESVNSITANRFKLYCLISVYCGQCSEMWAAAWSQYGTPLERSWSSTLAVWTVYVLFQITDPVILTRYCFNAGVYYISIISQC